MNRWVALLTVFGTAIPTLLLEKVTGLDTIVCFFIVAIAEIVLYAFLAVKLDSPLFQMAAIGMAVVFVIGGIVKLGNVLYVAGLPKGWSIVAAIGVAVVLLVVFAKWGMPLVRKAQAKLRG
ncbi:hypothetical protein Afil01_07290 [Actinorhabdospora filicis]|uniref:Uncharacterized protein n=1 Tax=Actinorhabdospora filicis TaxID=1785913 RepID=A0A9W6W1I1_9ACTN|nr:hypothetical protein [Actinorhabdospora filicis]GLZ75922.1 hypothetical protein Afil01_07290 [Actinorhabdospora filicis]